MAKPTKYATPICIGLTVLAAVGILIGILIDNALPAVLLLLPTAGYEVYRTEGKSTRMASWGLLVVLIAEVFLILFSVSFDLAEFFGESEREIGGTRVPLGDVKVVGPAVMIALSALLIARTRGVYTRWLAAIIAVTSFAIVFIIAPDALPDLIRSSANQAR